MGEEESRFVEVVMKVRTMEKERKMEIG